MKKSIIVTINRIGYHRYQGAPDDVSFLRNRHRHTFNIKLELEVTHDNRDLEFFQVKRELSMYLSNGYDTLEDDIDSCEMLAKEIFKWAEEQGWTPISCEVWEDKENGARVVL